MDENIYKEACPVSQSSILATRGLRRSIDLNPVTGTSDLLRQPGSSGSQSDNTRTATHPESAETTGYIPGVGMMGPEQSKVRPSIMLKIIVLVTFFLFCLLGAVTVFLALTVSDLKLSVSKQNQKTADDMSYLKLAVSKLNKKTADDLSALKLSQNKQNQKTTGDLLELKLSVSKLNQKTATNLKNVSSWLQQLMRKTEEVVASLTQLTHSDLHKERKALERQKMHAVTCPSGYRKYREVCYKAFDTKKTFSESVKTCQADGGTLAMPRDAGIHDFLVFLKNEVNRNADFWFGLHDQRQEHEWEWVDGTALGTGYSAWVAEDPSTSRWDNKNCAQLWRDEWLLWHCDREDRFICQYIPTGAPGM